MRFDGLGVRRIPNRVRLCDERRCHRPELARADILASQERAIMRASSKYAPMGPAFLLIHSIAKPSATRSRIRKNSEAFVLYHLRLMP
jgi:hypothetical protein